jgi:hypothetical protein
MYRVMAVAVIMNRTIVSCNTCDQEAHVASSALQH